MATRTSTPAGKRRTQARAAARSGHGKGTAKRSAPKSRPVAKGARPTRSSKQRSAARRPPSRRTAASRARPRARSASSRRLRLPRLSLRVPRLGTVALALLALAGLAVAYFAWFRDSALVAVEKVEVTGLSSPAAGAIEDDLSEAAKLMTTLNVNQEELERAVASYPTVVSLSADADFPHGLVIDVKERPPASIVSAGGDEVPVAADGTLLRGLELPEAEREALPVLEVEQLPSSDELSGDALTKAVVLGAAPPPLRPLIEGVSMDGERGAEVRMEGGIPIRFGSADQVQAKWAAAAAVLADPELQTLTYVDVRVPARPAVGGAAAPTAIEPEPVVPEEVVAPVEEVAPADPTAPLATEPTVAADPAL